MSETPQPTNSFVFEYQGRPEQTAQVFDQLLATMTDSSPEITGFRLELTTTDPVDIPVTVDTTPEPAIDDTGHTNGIDTTDTASPADAQSDDDTDPTDDSTGTDDVTEIPSLQPDALPARVLSLIHEDIEEPVRTSELTPRFNDEDIDTSRLSQTLASLNRRELVTAEPDPDDNRANIYWTTDRAEEALAALGDE